MFLFDKLKTIVRSVSDFFSNHIKLSFNLRAISQFHSKWFNFDLNLQMDLEVEQNEVV